MVLPERPVFRAASEMVSMEDCMETMLTLHGGYCEGLQNLSRKVCKGVWRRGMNHSSDTMQYMKLGIISDTHEHIDNIEKAKKVFAERGASPIIHLGDYCAGPAIRAFKGTKIIGIYGNNDGDLLRIEKNFREIGGDFRWDFCVLEFDGLKIACYHGTVPQITEALINCKTYDVVLTGHTHESHVETRNGVLAINPGSAHGFEKKGSVAILDTKTKRVEVSELQ